MTVNTSRLDRMKVELKSQGVEALLISDPNNIRYISGFTGSSGILLVCTTEAILLTDFRYIEQAKEEINEEEIQVVKYKPPLTDTIKEYLQKINLKTLYFEKKHLTYEEFEKFKNELDFIELKPHSGIVENLRICKDKDEINSIKKACEIVDEAFSKIIPCIKPGVKEKDVSLELEYYIKKCGADGISFDIIIASGERSALPHGVASPKKIRLEEFIKMDFGAVYNGYSSDITRTVVLGNSNEKQREIYQIVKKAQLEALKTIKPGMKACEADFVAREIINEAGYEDYFGHGLGHGIGLRVHELPTISSKHETILEPGMVVTVEPGIYLPGWGGVRIEDTVEITERGCKTLTNSTKDMIELKTNMN